MAYRGQDTSHHEEDPASQDQNISFPDISQDPKEWFYDIPDDSRQAECQPDLYEIQVKVGAHQRPG